MQRLCPSYPRVPAPPWRQGSLPTSTSSSASRRNLPRLHTGEKGNCLRGNRKDGQLQGVENSSTPWASGGVPGGEPSPPVSENRVPNLLCLWVAPPEADPCPHFPSRWAKKSWSGGCWPWRLPSSFSMLSSQVGHEAGQKPLTRIQKRESDGVPSPGDPSQAYTTTTEEGKSLQPFKATSIRWIPETVSRAASPRESSRDSRVRGDQSRHRTGAWVEVSVQNAKERPLEICNCSKMGGGGAVLGKEHHPWESQKKPTRTQRGKQPSHSPPLCGQWPPYYSLTQFFKTKWIKSFIDVTVYSGIIVKHYSWKRMTCLWSCHVLFPLKRK